MRGILFDLEGTLYVGDRALPGAAHALQTLRDRGWVLRFLTNATTRSTASLHARLRSFGLPIEQQEVLSALQAAVLHLRRRGSPRCLLLLNDDAQQDFAEFPQSDTDPEVIVVGDIGNRWNAELLQKLFGLMLGGAHLVTLHKGKYWEAGEGLRIDIGAFVAALEYASGRQATVIGKPSSEFFSLALESLGLPSNEVLMVGDDIETDVGAAQALGMTGVLVRTGKYRPDLAALSSVRPDAILDSVSAIPAWIESR